MNRLITLGLVATLCGTALAASAEDTMTKDGMNHMGMNHMGMKAVDANGDGMISKDEFTKHHDAMWEKCKKDSNGNVSVKDMEAMYDSKMMMKN